MRWAGSQAETIEIAAGERAGHDVGAGFDAVGDDAMAGAVELGDAGDAEGGGAGAVDVGAHLVEQGGEIDDFGFTRAVFEDGHAVGEGGGHHQVFGAGDGDFVEVDVGAVQAVGFGFDIAVLLGDLGAHLLEAFDVQVDGARADGASAGHGDAGDAHARDQRARAPAWRRAWS